MGTRRKRGYRGMMALAVWKGRGIQLPRYHGYRIRAERGKRLWWLWWWVGRSGLLWWASGVGPCWSGGGGGVLRCGGRGLGSGCRGRCSVGGGRCVIWMGRRRRARRAGRTFPLCGDHGNGLWVGGWVNEWVRVSTLKYGVQQSSRTTYVITIVNNLAHKKKKNVFNEGNDSVQVLLLRPTLPPLVDPKHTPCKSDAYVFIETQSSSSSSRPFHAPIHAPTHPCTHALIHAITPIQSIQAQLRTNWIMGPNHHRSPIIRHTRTGKHRVTESPRGGGGGVDGWMGGGMPCHVFFPATCGRWCVRAMRVCGVEVDGVPAGHDAGMYGGRGCKH